MGHECSDVHPLAHLHLHLGRYPFNALLSLVSLACFSPMTPLGLRDAAHRFSFFVTPLVLRYHATAH